MAYCKYVHLENLAMCGSESEDRSLRKKEKLSVKLISTLASYVSEVIGLAC